MNQRVAAFVIGPSKLSEMARSAGSSVRSHAYHMKYYPSQSRFSEC